MRLARLSALKLIFDFPIDQVMEPVNYGPWRNRFITRIPEMEDFIFMVARDWTRNSEADWDEGF